MADWVVHDLRRSLATGCQGMGIDLAHTEAILNHTGVQDVGEPGLDGFLDDVLNGWLVDDGQHLFRCRLGRWQESGTEPCYRNHSLCGAPSPHGPNLSVGHLLGRHRHGPTIAPARLGRVERGVGGADGPALRAVRRQGDLIDE